MPVTLSRGDRRLLAAGSAIFAVLVALGALISPTKGAEYPTTYSAASGGAKALYLLLQQSGYSVERWEQPVQQLPVRLNATLILAEPREYPSEEERAAVARFLNAGGHVLATGDVGAYFFAATVTRDPVEGLLWIPVRAVSPSAITRAAPVITMAPLNAWGHGAFGVPLYARDDNAHVVMMPVGEGRAIWVGAPTPLTNAGIREPGNLEFVLACLGPPGDRKILFDEYVHGHRRTLAASMWQSPVKWVLFQGAVFALVLLATYARRSGPIILPATESRLSPLEFVRTLGSLYARAGAASVAVETSSHRVRYRLTRRLGLSPNAPIDDIERALVARSAADTGPLIATLRECERAREATRLDPKTALRLVKELKRMADLKVRPTTSTVVGRAFRPGAHGDQQ